MFTPYADDYEIVCFVMMVCLNEVKRKHCHKVEAEIQFVSEFRFILTFFLHRRRRRRKIDQRHNVDLLRYKLW